MQVTYYGHACFLIETMGKRLLFDPFITGNELSDIDVDGIRCDFLLLTHAHSDHTGDVERVLKNNPDATVISGFETVSRYGSKGHNHHPLNHGGKARFDFGICKYVAAVHSSSFGDGAYGGNPGGFVIWNDEGCFYNSGDTALTMDMELLPMTCPSIDVAILPIGSNFTMNYHDALIASDLIRCNRIVGCHYDTFGFIKIDHEEATQAFTEKQKELVLMPIGATMEF